MKRIIQFGQNGVAPRRGNFFGKILLLFFIGFSFILIRFVWITTDDNDLKVKLKSLEEGQLSIKMKLAEIQEILSRRTFYPNSVFYDLRSILQCHDRSYEPEILMRGDFCILKNYVRADHGELKCHETITYTTHADFTFLDNLIPVLERFQAPVSVALHAPGNDFQPTLESILYLRECLPQSKLVRMYTTFHIYFASSHLPASLPHHSEALKINYNCELPPPYFNVSPENMYKTQRKMVYPVNVGRNTARDAALTHFVFACDIELYPSPGLVTRFFEMIVRNESYLHGKSPSVFVLPIFEVTTNVSVPQNKTVLQNYLRSGLAQLFHKNICPICHKVPKFDEWLIHNETNQLGVFHTAKRTGDFVQWEPIYIGTHAEPHYDDRLSWDGKSDKMTQGYALCSLSYDFHILDNAFLVHKPGIKKYEKNEEREKLVTNTNSMIHEVIYPELQILYGKRDEC